MDSNDRAIVRLEVLGDTKAFTWSYEDGGWYQMPDDFLTYAQVFYRLQGKQSPKSFQNLCFHTCSRDLPDRVGAAGQVTERVACTTRGRKM